MKYVFTIRNDNNYLTFKIINYEREQTYNFHDANWLTTVVECEVNPFRGTVKTSLLTIELKELLEQLTNLSDLDNDLKQYAFFTLEDNVSCTFKILETGVVSIDGCIKTSTTQLKFSFDSDLSFIDTTVKELKVVVDKFPVKDLPE